MQAHWSREDLPHWDKIRDADDMAGNGLRSRVIDIALDEVVDHLNANHPKSDDVRRVEAQRDTQKTKARRARRARDKWQAACEAATANAQMWMDEAIAQRERAALAEQERENWRITAINRATPADEPDPVEDKARELATIAHPEWPWGALSGMSQQEPLRRIARHVLGADDE